MKHFVVLGGDRCELKLNDKLNASEDRLRQKIGRRKVTALVQKFKAAAMSDPRLFNALYAKRDPYRWVAQHWAPKQP